LAATSAQDAILNLTDISSVTVDGSVGFKESTGEGTSDPDLYIPFVSIPHHLKGYSKLTEMYEYSLKTYPDLAHFLESNCKHLYNPDYRPEHTGILKSSVEVSNLMLNPNTILLPGLYDPSIIKAYINQMGTYLFLDNTDSANPRILQCGSNIDFIRIKMHY
jgi:hypothetical protein